MAEAKERSYCGEIKSIVDNLGLGLHCTVDSIIKGSRRSPDVIVKLHGIPVLIIEVKRPEIRPYVSDDEIIDQVIAYADEIRESPNYNNLKYIATHNLRNLLLLNFNPETNTWEKKFPTPWRILPEAGEISVYETNLEVLKERFLNFFLDFLNILEEKHVKPEEVKVRENVAQLIKDVGNSSINSLISGYQNDTDFRENFDFWRSEREIPSPRDDEQLRRTMFLLGSEHAYTMTIKLMFYHILRQNQQELHDKLSDIPLEGVRSIRILKKIYSEMFEEVIEVTKEFEVIFRTNFSDDLPINNDVLAPMLGLFNYIRDINWRKIQSDIIGKIFEKLIYDERRHLLGQFYTRSNVADLIIGFCIKNGEERIIDACCGSGTFLVRAYQRIKYLKPELTHNTILKRLIGIEIEKFPAMLAVVNLFIREPSKFSRPSVSNIDFFDDNVKQKQKIEMFRRRRPRTIDEFLESAKSEKKIDTKTITAMSLSSVDDLRFEIPDISSSIGNPPYTRQEEMEDAFFAEDYKEKLIEKTITPLSIEGWSAKASIYTYFFFKSHQFLDKSGKRMGYITSNSWLDAAFGLPLQQFILKSYKIIGFIHSEVEKWFDDAEINTIITILERNTNPQKRDENVVKFVTLKERLNLVIGETPVVHDFILNKNHWESIDEFSNKIESFEANIGDESVKELELESKTIYFYEDEILDIRMINQIDLSKFSKWGVILRAPAIFFKILDRGKEYISTISEYDVDIRRGYTTNANELYYLPSDHWIITQEDTEESITIQHAEQELTIPSKYIKRLIKSPQELPEYKFDIENSSTWLLFFHNTREELENDPDANDVLSYIDWMQKHISQAYIDHREFPSRVEKFFKNELRKRILDFERTRQHQTKEKPPTKRQFLQDIAETWLKDPNSILINPDWFRISYREGYDYLTAHGIHERFAFWINEDELLEDSRLYGLQFNKDIDSELVGVCLNLTFSYLGIELMGRTNLGKGALDVKVIDYEKVPIFDSRKIPDRLIPRIKDTYRELIQREILSISEEVKQQDRRKLDAFFLSDMLGLTSEDIEQLYSGICNLVSKRIKRSES